VLYDPASSMFESNNLPSIEYAEGLYDDYLKDPASVPPDWRDFFEQSGQRAGGPPARVGPSFRAGSIFHTSASPAIGGPASASGNRREAPSDTILQHRVDMLVRNFRVRGHNIAQLDPLGLPRPELVELDPKHYGFTDAELDRPFSTEQVGGADVMTLRKLIRRLKNTYCRSIGVQYMHIDSLAVREWLQQRMETAENRCKLNRDEQTRIFTRLTDAVTFEEFIQVKFKGAKSFSLEGAESLIPMLDMALEKCGEQGVTEVVIGMAHRGRLNVLANILGKSPSQIFREYEDADPELHMGRGDVKYHLGHSSDWTTSTNHKIHLSLCFNPSHLEFVNTVAMGRMRAKQDRVGDAKRQRGMVLLIHGDAAFAGEGIIQETLNLSELRGYRVGGTLHIVVNNQVGFTTSPYQSRSSIYATDVAKMLQIPIFHVNGEDPESVAQVLRLALDFREKFKRDVVIDMYCYRRRGHNEGDEPSFTQPLLYQAINKRKSVREGYLDHLLKMKGLTREEADTIAQQRKEHLERELSEARREDYVIPAEMKSRVWHGYMGGPDKDAPEVDTGCNWQTLSELLETLCDLPKTYHPHPKIERFLDSRRSMARGEKPIDWATAEALAFATLAVAGHPVRLSGQDVERGTFSQRHAVLHDIENGEHYNVFAHLSTDQAKVDIINSPLSEAGVLGFDYGYSLDRPKSLVMWEAQFGDFNNAAQVIIDQFIASAEDKWRRLSGITLLLPHGFEGMGPEHSHARLERFMALAAEDNIQIVNCSTPAQYFHCLRRQVLRPWRKPLIMMTPKSLLRHPRCVSTPEELSNGHFQRLIPDALPGPFKKALLCSGKVYYDLLQERETRGANDVAIVRMEQLYPLQDAHLAKALEGLPDGKPVVWVQEEPENMGAWRSVRLRFLEKMLGRYPFKGVFRPAGASPATGSANSHKIEQKQLMNEAFAD
jgi:2-oxoglutarate dehydrogenase E1 component